MSIDSVDVISQLNSLSIKYIMSEFSCSLKAEQITFFFTGMGRLYISTTITCMKKK